MSSIDRDTLNAALAPVYAALGTAAAHVVDLYINPDHILATVYVTELGGAVPRSIRVTEAPHVPPTEEELGREHDDNDFDVWGDGRP